MSSLDWILHQQEGQFFERKSCFDHSKGKTRLRPVRDVARVSNMTTSNVYLRKFLEQEAV